MARRASRIPWTSSGGPAPRGGQADRASGPAGRGRVALCPAPAIPPADLSGTRLPSRRLGVVSRLCPAALGLDAEKVGAAADDRRRPGGDVGEDPSGAAGRCPP